MSKSVFGVGINDGSRPARFDSKSMTKEYDLWTSMLRRCFSEKYQTKFPTYKGCSVSDNFLNYSYFYDWCQEQIGFGNIDEKGIIWPLDKDILYKDNKMYNENTCVFVPQEANLFFNGRGSKRGNFPIGVCQDKYGRKFVAKCQVGGTSKYLGCFDTPQEAFDVYKTFKEALCKQLALKWKDEIDPRVYEAMMKWEVSITS